MPCVLSYYDENITANFRDMFRHRGHSLPGVIQVSDHFFHFDPPFHLIRVNPVDLLLVFSPVLYTNTHIPPAMTDARSADRMGNYTKFWDKDREHEKSEVQGARVENYTELVNGQPHSPLAPFTHVLTGKFPS